MKTFTLDSCKWYVDAEKTADFKARALERFQTRWRSLHKFLREEGLFSNSEMNNDVQDWSSFCIKSSDLTELGFDLFKRCHNKWIKSSDRGRALDNIDIWIKELRTMRCQPAAGALRHREDEAKRGEGR